MKGTDVGFLLLIRFILDFLCAFKPRPIWEILYGMLFCIVGFVLLADEEPGSVGFSGLFVLGGAGWSLYWLYKMCKPKKQTEQQEPAKSASDEKESSDPPKTPEEGK